MEKSGSIMKPGRYRRSGRTERIACTGGGRYITREALKCRKPDIEMEKNTESGLSGMTTGNCSMSSGTNGERNRVPGAATIRREKSSTNENIKLNQSVMVC